jgi:hypothetical protein
MKTKLLFTFIFILTLFYSSFSNAQENDSTSRNFVQKNFSISGDIGAYGELYSMKGQPKRRPSSTGRIFFRPTLNLFGILQIPFEFLVSTEGSSLRQNINQFGINPKWDWGSLHAGDFSEDYSQFTLNGVKIRGGGINLTPGWFRFSTASGFTQRSVPGGAQDGSFKRFILASKLGFGYEESSFFDLIFVRAKDEIGSLPQADKSITILTPNGNDVWAIGSPQTIKWISDGITGGVRIQISRDGGSTFELIQDNVPNVGFFNWTVQGPVTFQALVKITSNDDPNVFDMSDAAFTVGSGVDSKIGNINNQVVNANAVTPQENLVVGAKGKFSFFENLITLEIDGGGSIYSRDLRASEINLDSIDIPKFLTKIYKPRVGTNYDYAYSNSLSLNLTFLSTKIGHKYVGPGYNSLGSAYILTDIEELSILNSLRISKYGFIFGYIRQSDNVIDQKIFTTTRNIITFGLNGMLTDFWTASISSNILTMSNDSKSDSTKTDFGSFALSTTQSFLIDQTGFLRNINLNYSYQNSENNSYLVKNNATSVHTMCLGFGFVFAQNINAVLSGGFVNSTVFDTLKTFTHNYSLMLQHSSLSNKLVNSLNFSAAVSESNTSFRSTLISGFRFTEADNISLSLSYIRFNGASFSGGSFNEILTSLGYSHHL